MAGYLIAEEGPLAGLIVHLEEGEEWILGRDPDEVSIVLEDPMVSRKHAICRLTAEGFILENLSSVNPITQNGKIITDPVLLRESDILQIGSTFFRFSEKTPSLEEPIEEVFPPAPEEEAVIEEKEDLSSVNVQTSDEVRWFLKVISGPNSGAEFALQKGSTYILGKDPNLCDIVFQDLSVSRQHARLIVDNENAIFIEDLGSRNGVLVNGEQIADRHAVASQDLVALGTTSFLMLDREQIHETIISPPYMQAPKMEEEIPAGSIAAEAVMEKRDWREMVIPKKHLVLAGIFAVGLIGGLAGMLALFNSNPVVIPLVDHTGDIREALSGFDEVQFSYNPGNGKIFLVGHVLTTIDKQEVLYKIGNLTFIKNVEDNIVVDELVWENTNALLMTNPNWVGVSIYSPSPGRFVVRGYLQTLDQMQALTDYLNLNFPYLDKLENQVVIETNLETQLQSLLLAKGFNSVTLQLSNGEIVLAGRVDQKHSHTFDEIVDQMKGIKGVRMVKNFVIYTTADTSRIDLSAQYRISGYSKKDDENMFIVINGRILKIGDAIDGMTVTGILPNTVLLEKDGLKFRINYNLQ
jgi:type III secretion system YscD/HrpQ family protein